MKTSKRVLSALLAFTIAASFTACGAKPAASTPASKAASVAGSPSTPATPESYFPLKDKIKVTMAAARRDEQSAFADTDVMKLAETETNIQVEWIDWSVSVIKEKRGLAFASGDLPDAFYGTYVLDAVDLMQYGPQGLLMDLKPFIEDGSMPNFKAAIDKHPEILTQLTAPDGKIYALPTIDQTEPAYVNSDATLINKTWLDKVKKEIPTTTEELYDVLKAFKAAGDLNGNGKNDEIPLTFRYGDNNNGQRSMFGWFGLAPNTNNAPMVTDDGKITWPQIQPEYKDACTYFNTLYKEGLLDPEAFTMDGPAYSAKTLAETPSVGVMSTWSAYLVNNAAKNGDKYVYLPSLSGNGKTPQIQPRTYSTAYNGRIAFALNAKTKYAKELISWADRWYDVDRSIDTYLGGEKYIKKVSDGVYTKIPNEDGSLPDWTAKSWYSPANYSLISILSDDFKYETLPAGTADKGSANDIYGKYLPKNQYPTTAFLNPEENEIISKLIPDVTSYLDQSTAEFITKGITDDKWTAYVAKMDDLKIQDMIKVWQSVWDRNSK